MLTFKCNECEQISKAEEWLAETKRLMGDVSPLNEFTVLDTVGYHCPKCGDYNDGIKMERVN